MTDRNRSDRGRRTPRELLPRRRTRRPQRLRSLRRVQTPQVAPRRVVRRQRRRAIGSRRGISLSIRQSRSHRVDSRSREPATRAPHDVHVIRRALPDRAPDVLLSVGLAHHLEGFAAAVERDGNPFIIQAGRWSCGFGPGAGRGSGTVDGGKAPSPTVADESAAGDLAPWRSPARRSRHPKASSGTPRSQPRATSNCLGAAGFRKPSVSWPQSQPRSSQRRGRGGM